MASVIIGAALIIGPLILVTSIAIGVLGFNPERAQAIRSAESSPQVVIEEIRRIHVGRPEQFRHERLDRHPHYLALHAAALCYAISIFGGSPVTSNVASLAAAAKFTLAACFLVGAVLVVTGSLMGVRVGPCRFFRGVRDNLVSARLRDDVRLPYTFGGAGMLSMSVSLGLYASTSFKSTYGSLGGWMTLWYAGACAVLLVMFYRRTKQYVRLREALIAEAVAHIERDGHVDR